MVKIQTYSPNKKDSYIVVLHNNVDKDDHLNWLSRISNTVANITHNYDSKFLNGFTGEFGAAALNALRDSKDVKTISENHIMKLRVIVEQPDAPWGISRISQQQPHAGANAGNLDFTYRYDTPNITPVDVYVVDSGININHDEFEGRATWGITIAEGVQNPNDTSDTNGHGTHCAGIIGSRRFGVAKNVKLIAVKVTIPLPDGPGIMAGDAIQGFEYVWEQALTSGRASVVNLSLGAPAPAPVLGEEIGPMEEAINTLIATGVHVVAAAGNDNVDVLFDIPGRFPAPITVAASNILDGRWPESNWGANVDIFAPGVDITSTGIANPTARMIMTGTSMACPHVSGLVAYLIGLQANPNVPPDTMKQTIRQDALQAPPVLGDGSIDRLAYNGM